MRAALILFALALAAAIGAYAVLGAPEDEDQPKVAVAAAIGEEPAPPEKHKRVATRPPSIAESKAIRQIAPETIAAPAASEVQLVREDPRPPLGELGLARTRRPGDASGIDGMLLHRPVAISAGRIEAAGYRIRIVGIIPTSPEKICRGPDGADAPCGMRARTALRHFLRGRAIRCDVPDTPGTEEVEAECWLGTQDIGAWLVEYGWALPDGDRYQAIVSEARNGEHNMFSRLDAGGQ